MTNKTEALQNLGHSPEDVSHLNRKDSHHHHLIQGSDKGVGESTGQAEQSASMGGSVVGSSGPGILGQ